MRKDFSPLEFLACEECLVASIADRGFSSFIYIIQAGERGPVKIGCAADPYARLRLMQTGNHLPLIMQSVIACGARHNVENEAHRLANDHRIRGEWFDLSPLEAVEFVLRAAKNRRAHIQPLTESFDHYFVSETRAEQALRLGMDA